MDLKNMSDAELEAGLKRHVLDERDNLADIIEHLAEFDGRRLAVKKGFPSLFKYCTAVLGYAEGAAYKRINCARAVERFPTVLILLREGKLHLEAISILSPHLNNSNHRELLERAMGKTSLELEVIAAPFKSTGACRDSIHPVVMRSPVASSAGQGNLLKGAHPEVLPSQVPNVEIGLRIAFTASQGCFEKLKRAEELLRHKFPFGGTELIVDQALDDLLDRRDPERRIDRKKAERKKRAGGADGGRRIPQWVRDEVWRRDEGSCAFVGQDGQRCPGRAFLEYDHIIPFALGGPSDTPKNVRLLCRSHNQEAGRQAFGGSSSYQCKEGG